MTRESSRTSAPCTTLSTSPLSSSLIQAVLTVTGMNPSPWTELLKGSLPKSKDDPQSSDLSQPNDTVASRDQGHSDKTARARKIPLAPVSEVAGLVSALWPSFGSHAGSKSCALAILVLACQCKSSEEARLSMWNSPNLTSVLSQACSLLPSSENGHDPSSDASTAAAQFLWFLSRSPPRNDVLSPLSWDLASALVNGLHDNSLACALAISNLSTVSLSLRRAVMSRDGALSLVQLIRDNIGELQEAAAATLMSLTAGMNKSSSDESLDDLDHYLEEISDAIIEAGGIKALVDVARNGDPIVQSTAVGVIQNMSGIHGNARVAHICDNGSTLNLLMDVIQGLGTEEAITSSLHTLSNLALCKDSHASFLSSPETLPALIRLCYEAKTNHYPSKATNNRSSYDLLIEVVANLCRSGDGSTRSLIIKQGGACALRDAIQASSSEGKSSALSALVTLSSESSLAQSLVNTDGLVGCLLQTVLSSAQQASSSELTMKVLANLTLGGGPEVKGFLLNAGLANILSISLSSLSRVNVSAINSQLQIASLRACMNLARDSEARKQFAATSITSSILRLISKTLSPPPSSSSVTRDSVKANEALGALYNLMTSRSIIGQVVRFGGLKILAQLLQLPQTRVKAARCLRRVAVHGDEVMRRELVERLGRVFQASTPISIINEIPNK